MVQVGISKGTSNSNGATVLRVLLDMSAELLLLWHTTVQAGKLSLEFNFKEWHLILCV
jgi:hypothetical protein